MVQLAIVIAATLTAAALPAAGSADPTEPPAAPSDPGTAAFLPGLADPTEPADPPPSSTEAEREASEVAYRGEDDAEALATLREHSGGLVSAELFPELATGPGEHVERYYGAYTAVIDDGDGPATLAEGGLPLRAREHGQMRPVDGDLVADGQVYEAANAVVDVALPSDLTSGIVFDHLGVTVTPSATADASPAIAADKLFYGGADTDTDLLLAPVPAGAELAYQLRSPAAPEEQELTLDFPAGAQLVSVADGAEVQRGSEVLVEVQAPKAWDAEGTAVPVHYEIDGSTLRVVVDHRGGDWLYPIVVDPLIESYYQWDPPGATDPAPLEYWRWGSNFSGPFTYWAYPLYNIASGGNTYFDGAYGEWIADPIRSSFIERVDFFNFDRSPTSPGACTVMGIWDAYGNWWVWGQQRDTTSGATNTGYTLELCNNRTHDTRQVWAGSEFNDADAPTGSLGIFALSSRAGYRSAAATNLLRSATVYRSDRNDPGVVFTGTLPPTGWRDDGNATQSISAYGTDAGLGMKAFELRGSTLVNPANGSSVIRNQHSCTGRRDAPCPYDWSTTFNYRLNEGRGSLDLYGQDIINRWGPVTQRTQRIDRTPPVVTPSGSLHDSAQSATQASPAFLYGPSYSLQIDAADGSTSSPAAERSGVRDLTISVDNTTVYSPAAISCPNGSCGGSWNWTLNTDSFSDGPHTIRVVVRDQLAHAYQRTYYVEIDRRGDIYHARKVTGNPANGGTVLRDEWAALTARVARSEEHDGPGGAPGNPVSILSRDTIKTRQTIPCTAIGSTPGSCGETRSLTTTSLSDNSTDKTFTRYRGVSADDPRLELVAEMLEQRQDFGNDGTPASASAAVQPWQTPPPASSGSYLKSRATIDQTPLAVDVWLEQDTKLPLRIRILDTSTGAGIANKYWDYEPRRLTEAELPSGFFTLSKPTDARYAEEVDADSAGASLGATSDNDTGANFLPYDLGDQVVLQLQLAPGPVRLCLIGVDTVRFTEPPEAASDVGGDFENENPGSSGKETLVVSNYVIRPSSQSCPPSWTLGRADVEVISTHPDSQYGRDAEAAHVIGLAAGFSPNLTNPTAPLFREPIAATQTVLTGDDQTSTWVEPATGPASVVVQGPIELPFVPAVVAALRPR